MSIHQTTFTSDPQVGSIVLEAFHPFLLHQNSRKIGSIRKQIISKVKNIQLNPLNSVKIYNNPKTQGSFSQILENTSSTSQSYQKTSEIQISTIVKHVMKSNYERLLCQYEGTGKNFTDPDFPPTGKSIGGRWINHNNWKRISQIITNCVFVNQKIQPGDILQGEIGDCYFLSALAALAQNDYRIKNIFPSLQIQKNGIYMARILYRGILQQVVIDDYIPVNQKNTPLFAKPSGGNQIWVIILQKCWAKLHKSYSIISGGLPHQVLHAFSGAPTLYNSMPRNKQQQDILFLSLYNAQKNGGVLCCGTKFDPQIQKKGLVIGHAYTLLQIFDHPYKMMKIRNPWGQKQWNGKASQKDIQFWNKITEKDKVKLGYLAKNDGTFFMLWEDFIQVFNMIDLCLIDDSASYLSLNSVFSNEKGGNMFEFNLQQPGRVVFSITQDNLRTFKSEIDKKRGYAKTTIIFSKVKQRETTKHGYDYSFLKASQYHVLPDHYMTFDNLQPGKYVIFVSCDWFSQLSKQATVSVYSAARMHLQQTNQINYNQFLYQVFMDHARRNTKKRQAFTGDQSQWMCSQFLLDKCGYGYAAYHIDEFSSTKLGIELDENQYTSKNLQLLRPYSGNGKMKTLVSPGQQLIILFKIDPYRSSPSFSIPLPKVYKLVSG